jgi:hypothetical protein
VSEISARFAEELQIPPSDNISLIAEVAEENLMTMTDTLIEGLEAELTSKDDLRAACAGTILLKLTELADLEQEGNSGRSVKMIWDERITRAITTYTARIVELSHENLAVALAAYHAHLISVADLIDWHGVTAPFEHLTARFIEVD